MKLRLILIVLSLLAFLSASTGGIFYYHSLKKASFLDAERKAAVRLTLINNSISSFLSQNVKPVQTLAELDIFRKLLVQPDKETQKESERILDLFKRTLAIDVSYILNAEATTVATSNRNDPDSFMSFNFGFRPYFTTAMQGQAATYLALGTTSGKRGGYYSFPIYDKNKVKVLGVAVIKTSIELIEKELITLDDEYILVIDPHGVIFISNKIEWVYSTVNKLSPQKEKEVANSKQFGNGPWNWVGLKPFETNRSIDSANNRYLMYTSALNNYPGWQVIYLRDMKSVYQAVSSPLLRITGQLALTLSVLVGLSVFYLYRKAAREIQQRKNAQEALKKSDRRYRSLYNDTPAMLHSIDPSGHLISVSKHWLATLGYKREEVIGKKITDFFTEDSRRYAEESIIPVFFKKGFVKDIPYQFVKKNGTIIDILLSAISVKDNKGVFIHSLAVSVDITQRKHAEEMLQKAKEELSRYSIELEQQVLKRTEEISMARDQLRRLSASVINSQEIERAAIARELHDELGQVLTALRLDAAWLEKQLAPKAPDYATRANAMCELIDHSIDEVRGIAFKLRPGMLDDLGLVDALDLYSADFERRSGITVIFKHKDVPSVSGTIATAAYRITQEALTNVARHSRANYVEINLKSQKGSLQLRISDNGCGFQVNSMEKSNGLGLTGMRERALLVGGELLVDSEPGKGTSISFQVKT